MESIKFSIPKKGKTNWELFPNYGYREMKFTGLGLAIGLLVMLIVIAIQSLLFPLKEVPFEDLGYGAEYIESVNEGMVLIDRNIPMIITSIVIVTFGVLVTIPNVRMTDNMTIIDTIQMNKVFLKKQQKFLNEKSKLY